MLPALPSHAVPPCALSTRRSSDPLLLWVREGAARVEVEGREHRLGTGQAIRIAAGVPHAIRTARGTVAVPIWLPRSAVLGDDPPLSLMTVPPGWEPYLVHLFAQSLGYLRSSTDLGLFELMSAAGRVPVGAPRQGQVPLPPLPRSADAFGVAHRLLRAPGTSDSVDELGAHAGLSARTLQRRFAEETGLTLTAWRTRVRLAAAAEHLARGWDVGQAAAEVGFESASGFTRAFHALTGVTPRTLRRPARLGSDSASAATRLLTRADTMLLGDPPPLPPSETWPRVNGSHVAVWVYRGTAHVVAADRAWDLAEGDAIVLPAGVSTHVRVDPDSLLLPVGFRTCAGAPITPDALATMRFAAADVPLLLHSLVATYTPLRPAGHRDARLFDEIAARTIRIPEPPVAPGQRVAGDAALSAEAVAALAGHLAQHPLDRTSLAVWARRLGTDTRTLHATFRATTGTGFVQWRRLSRMTRGREQLSRGIAPSAVSRGLGYAHPSAFSRAFAAVYGVAPQRFQAEIQGSVVGVARRAQHP